MSENLDLNAKQPSTLVFTMNFYHREGTGGGGILMGSLISVYQSVKTLVTRLHRWFDDSLRHYVFFSASMDSLVSDIFSGARDIQNETPKSLPLPSFTLSHTGSGRYVTTRGGGYNVHALIFSL